MKAKIWKDRETGRWLFMIPGAMITAGTRPTWEQARDAVLGMQPAARM